MPPQTVAGIDIGTHYTKIVVVKKDPNQKKPRIIGTGIAETRGMRHGHVEDSEEVASSVANALTNAKKSAATHIEEVYLAITGTDVTSVRTRAAINIERSDKEITDIDLENVEETCERHVPRSSLQNRQVLHRIPLSFFVDDEPVFGSPIGMRGKQLGAEYLFVTAIEKHVIDLIDAVEQNGVDVLKTIAAPLAAGCVSLTKQQRTAGCILALVGAETVTAVTYEEGVPLAIVTYSIGSTDITNDIALCLKLPLDEAQRIKHGDNTDTQVSRKKVQQIIGARLSDIFELLNEHLTSIRRAKLLPAGIVFAGGGASLSFIADQARQELELPSTVAKHDMSRQHISPIPSGAWAAAYGVCIFGLYSDNEQQDTGTNILTRIWRTLVQWGKQLLP